MQALRLNSNQLLVIAGPCVVEDDETCFQIADELKKLSIQLGFQYIFKASFIKANRSHKDSFRGLALEKSWSILRSLKNEMDIPITTDVHNVEQINQIEEWIDMIQIPAFLCRQTELLEAAGRTGKIVNIKKGQFMHAASMKFAVEKVKQFHHNHCLVTERGNCFGYHDLIVDMRQIPILNSISDGAIIDCTHSTQRTNLPNGISGGNPKESIHILQAAIAAGAKGVFVETHPQPSKALSDSASMIPLSAMTKTLSIACRAFNNQIEIDAQYH